MTVTVLLTPREGERDVVHDVLGDAAVWAVDGDARALDAEVALTFFPRRELKALGRGWGDFPHLRLIQSCTAGLNHMGWQDAPSVPLAATPGATGPFIAEYVLGAIIGWARGMWHHTQAIRRGRFEQGALVRGLSELRVGLVGYGGIGQAVAEVLAPHGCSLEAVNRSGTASPEATARLDALHDLRGLTGMASRCDVLVVCLPLTVETEGLIGIDLLSGMTGRPALLVNVARGPIVREAELFAWLDSSHTKHAAVLDVWWQYPEDGRPFSEAFHTLPNVVMTPHNSPNVGGFRLAMLRQACEQVARFLATGAAEHVHDPAWYGTRAEGDGR